MRDRPAKRPETVTARDGPSPTDSGHPAASEPHEKNPCCPMAFCPSPLSGLCFERNNRPQKLRRRPRHLREFPSSRRFRFPRMKTLFYKRNFMIETQSDTQSATARPQPTDMEIRVRTLAPRSMQLSDSFSFARASDNPSDPHQNQQKSRIPPRNVRPKSRLPARGSLRLLALALQRADQRGGQIDARLVGHAD